LSRQIIEFARKYDNVFLQNLDAIIRISYSGKLENVKTLIELLMNLPYYSDNAQGYLSLFNFMKINNHLDTEELIILAYKVKVDMFFLNSILLHSICQQKKKKLNCIGEETYMSKHLLIEYFLFSVLHDDS